MISPVALSILKSVFRSIYRPTPRGAVRRAGAAARDFVAFVTPLEHPHFLSEGERLESPQASVRLRVALPAQELARRVPVCLVPVEYVQRDPSLAALGRPLAVVVGKLPLEFFTQEYEHASAFVDWIERAALTHRVLVDFSDDLAGAATMYGQPILIEFQERLLRACPATVPTKALQERLAADSRHRVTVIEDPYETPQTNEPRLAPGPVLRLAWFGVFGHALRPFLETQFAAVAQGLGKGPVELAFVTHPAQSAIVQDMGRALKKVNPQFHVRHVAWSLSDVARELRNADMIVLPQDADGDWGRAKSHNRLVESIRAGRFTVASPIPAYLEMTEYAWIGAELSGGIEWALANRVEALERVRAGQAYVAERFAPSRIAEKWARLLEI